MPCLSCAPKYDPGPDIGSSAPILMVLSCACAPIGTATRSPAASAPAARRRTGNRIVMALLRADLGPRRVGASLVQRTVARYRWRTGRVGPAGMPQATTAAQREIESEI